MNKSGRATSAVLHNLTAGEREARARALRGAATEDRTAPEYFQAEAVGAPVEAAEPNVPLTRDALRQRELEEMRGIQEQEKTDGARKKQEDEVRHRDIQAARRATGASGTSADDRGRSMLARSGRKPVGPSSHQPARRAALPVDAKKKKIHAANPVALRSRRGAAPETTAVAAIK